MKRTTARTTGLVAAAAALAVSGYAVAGAGQAATPHAGMAGMAGMGHHATTYRGTTPVIRIANYAFHAPLSVRKGATVTIRNTDATTHTVTSNKGLFGVRIPAHSTRTIKAPGRTGNFGFHCNFHASMTGTLRVR